MRIEMECDTCQTSAVVEGVKPRHVGRVVVAWQAEHVGCEAVPVAAVFPDRE